MLIPTELPLTVIIKVTDSCNLRCRYCYHSDRGYGNNALSIDKLSSIYDLILKGRQRTKIIWHGGEPLLLGLDFYKEAFDLQKEYECQVSNSIQTNGSLLNQSLIELFRDNDVTIGISYDGPFHSLWRGKTEETLSSIELVKSLNARMGLLTVIPPSSIAHYKEIYDHFKNICGDSYNLKINVMSNSGAAKTNLLFDDDPVYYYNFLSKMFDMWIFDSSAFSISTFIDYVSAIACNKNRICTMSSCLFKFISIDSECNIYPCGKSYPQEYCLGSIYDVDSIDDVFESDRYNRLVLQSISRRNVCMSDCEWYKYCEGGCNNDAIISGDICCNDYFECKLRKMMFKHVQDLLLKGERQKFNKFVKKLLNYE